MVKLIMQPKSEGLKSQTDQKSAASHLLDQMQKTDKNKGNSSSYFQNKISKQYSKNKLNKEDNTNTDNNIKNPMSNNQINNSSSLK